MFHPKLAMAKFFGGWECAETIQKVLGDVPVAIYNRQGLRVTYGPAEAWIDRLPRTWEGQTYRVEVIYQDQAHAALGETIKEATGWLLAGVLGVSLNLSE